MNNSDRRAPGSEIGCIAITGGTGSFGSAFTRFLLAETPCKIRLISRDEHKHEALMRDLNDARVTFILGDRVTGCDSTPRGVKLRLSEKELRVDAVLVAAGRQGNVQGLNLEVAGIHAGGGGVISVNENFQTEQPHIYAAGDVIGFPALASTSMEQARMAMVHAFDLGYKKSVASVLPLAIYTIPEVAMAGETEKSLLAKGIEYVVGRSYYDRNARGKIIGDRDGVLKLIFGLSDMKLLGVSVVGEIAE